MQSSYGYKHLHLLVQRLLHRWNIHHKMFTRGILYPVDTARRRDYRPSLPSKYVTLWQPYVKVRQHPPARSGDALQKDNTTCLPCGHMGVITTRTVDYTP